ncbi:MAG: hypothetical protein KIS81_02365 [Maricaulaceae bacterium]|nr:hypothetical protein [Maricaulaceae bacterium]
MWLRSLSLVIALGLLTGACGHRSPSQTHDACQMLQDNRSWWRALQRSERQWGVSPGIQLATINRESSFRRNARPPRNRILGVIPGSRPSSARGYAQALDTTWQWYQRDTGNTRGRRNNFADAADFVGWYSNKSRQLSGIALTDARALYLAYHEGHTGYNRGSYRSKAWLLRAADQVAADAQRYDAQIRECRGLRRRFGVF